MPGASHLTWTDADVQLLIEAAAEAATRGAEEAVAASFEAGRAVGLAAGRFAQRGLEGLLDISVEKDGTLEVEPRRRRTRVSQDPYDVWSREVCRLGHNPDRDKEPVDNWRDDDHIGIPQEDTMAENEKNDPKALEDVKAKVQAKREATAAEGQKLWNFTGAYGTMVMATEPPQIHDYIQKLRLAVGSLEARVIPKGASFPVKSSKELMQKLAQALVDLHMAFYPIELVPLVMEDVTFATDRGPKPGTGVHLRGTYRLVAPDHSFVDFQGFGGGLDRDDKAGGKASTYAYKDALLKALGIPEKELVDTDDESGHGADRTKKPAKRSPADEVVDGVKAASTGGPADVARTASAADFVARISAAADGQALVSIAAEARNALDAAGQSLAGAAYRARKKELGL